jgi:hypothetical protein
MTHTAAARPGRARTFALAAALAALGVACGDSGGGQQQVLADDIAVAHTPPGGYGDVMPPPILARCTEPLSPDAPDLRGLWKTVAAWVSGAEAPPEHPVWQHVERVEQCGNRVIVTSSGVIHDMRADGTAENGVNDFAVNSYRPIQVVATFENRVLVLRPVGVPGLEVTRERDGDAMVWHYGPSLLVHLNRIDG